MISPTDFRRQNFVKSSGMSMGEKHLGFLKFLLQRNEENYVIPQSGCFANNEHYNAAKQNKRRLEWKTVPEMP